MPDSPDRGEGQGQNRLCYTFDVCLSRIHRLTYGPTGECTDTLRLSSIRDMDANKMWDCDDVASQAKVYGWESVWGEQVFNSIFFPFCFSQINRILCSHAEKMPSAECIRAISRNRLGTWSATLALTTSDGNF